MKWKSCGRDGSDPNFPNYCFIATRTLYTTRLHDAPAKDGHKKKGEPSVKNIIKKCKTEDNKIRLT